jgi:hypothetical protein
MQPTMNRCLRIAGIHKSGTALAVLLLLFPTLATVSPTFAPDCCSGKMCPVHYRHPMSTNASANTHMDCEHEGMDLMPCSLSCGHSDDEGLQTSSVFLLPGEIRSVGLIPVERAALGDLALPSDLSIRPLTPPPRFQAWL